MPDGLPLGTQDYPDRSATVVIEVDGFEAGETLRLAGPGVESIFDLTVAGLPDGFLQLMADNRALFPRGLDFVLTAGRYSRRAAVPPASSPGRTEPCMSPSRGAKPPLKTPADRRRGERPFRPSPRRRLPNSCHWPSIASWPRRPLYDPGLAALAIRQARGDMIEAIFILRAYRTTLPRFGSSQPLDTRHMRIERRDFRHLQGPARRPTARPDLRLYSSADRS